MTETSTAETLYLVIDQGGHASRAMVFDHTGHVKSEDTQVISASQPEAGHVEYDPDALVTSVFTAIRNVISNIGDQADNIVSAGLATQRSNIACWDKENGMALCPIISWQDTRTYESLNEYEAYIEQIHKLTGLFLNAHYGASKFRWCMKNVKQVQQACEDKRLVCSPMTSFLLHHILEERPVISDYTNASRTLLWNLNTLDWDEGLFKLFEVPADSLPQCVPNHFPFGTLKVDGHAIPLQLVTGDQPAALYASGSLQADMHYINAGTGAFIQHPTGSTAIPSNRLLSSLVMHDGQRGCFVIEGTVNGAGSALQWFMNEHSTGSLFDQLPDWLDEEQSPPLFLNGVSGLGSPFWKADFESRYIGDSDIRGKAVAVVESIVFLLQKNIDEMSKQSEKADKIQITGGLSRLDGLCQKLADLSGLPVYRPANCEATARGLAWLLACNNSQHEWSETGEGTRFESHKNDDLLSRYQQWNKAMNEAL